MTSEIIMMMSQKAAIPEVGYSLGAWGTTDLGRIGTGESSFLTVPTALSGTWQSLNSSGTGSLYDDWCIGVKTDGSLWSWGTNSAGALGTGSTTATSSPVQIGALTNWNKVACGSNHALAVKTDGTLWSWGANAFGQLGDGTTANKSSPIQVGALTTWAQVGTTTFTSYAINTSGELFSWGKSGNGALGNGTITPALSSPVQIGAMTNWSSLSSAEGVDTVFSVKTDGTLWTWGANASGQQGTGSTTTTSSPVQVGALTDWSKIRISMTGGFFTNGLTAAIKTDGSLWNWGNTPEGLLSSPVQVGALTNWSDVAVLREAIVANKTDGTLWSWGNGKTETNLLGYLISTTTPTVISSPIQVGSISTATKLGVGASVGAYFAGTDLFTWGGFPQNGLNKIGTYSSPVQVGASNFWKSIEFGRYGALALSTDGDIYAWGGNNISGQMGTTNWVQSNPVQISGISNVASISFTAFSCAAVTASGKLYTWGSASSGQLGNSTTTPNLSSVTQVGALTNWSKAVGGNNYYLSVKTDGTLWTWGSNGSGQLGDGTVVSKSSPIQVGALTSWKSVSTGSTGTSAAITVSGSLWTWGDGSSGILGTGSTASQSSPVQVGALAVWSNVSLGLNHALAVRTDGTLWSWGKNNLGQLGDGTTADKSSPVQIGALTNWKSVAAGSSNSLAVTTAGEFYAWGNSLLLPSNRSSPVQVGALTNWNSADSSLLTSSAGAFSL